MVRVALGLYFLVSGALHLPAALYALGVESVGMQRWVLWAVPLIQAAVSFAAGWYLVKMSPPAPQPAESEKADQFHHSGTPATRHISRGRGNRDGGPSSRGEVPVY
jgi:hypothetical protein